MEEEDFFYEIDLWYWLIMLKCIKKNEDFFIDMYFVEEKIYYIKFFFRENIMFILIFSKICFMV